MTDSLSESLVPEDYNYGSLDHLIIWLDAHIGDPGSYHRLKRAFSSTLDPMNERMIKLSDTDYDCIFDVIWTMSVSINDVQCLLMVFTDIERCIECFEQNQHKRVFFITSESMGKIAIPRILQRFKHTFTDPITNDPYTSIYVFCYNIQYEIQWALEYKEYIQMFTHEADLLARMTRDIANYYVIKSKRLLYGNTSNNLAAYHRLCWAHELYQRYGKLENVSMRKELDEVNKLLIDLEEKLKSSSDEEDLVS